MFKVFTRLSNFFRNLRTIVSGGFSFFAGVWRRCTALAAENLFLRKQLALFREREKKADAHDSCRQVCILQTGSLVRLAWCLDDRQTSHFDRLASQCVPPVLALEIETGREATSDSRSQGLDPAFSG